MKNQVRRQQGFTLIEVLTVIAIIGLLVGLLVPAVMFALNKVKANAIAMEVITLADAVEKYNAKYGDYPPDGSDAATVQRHLRKLFPQIAASELTLLSTPAIANAAGSGAPNGVMDPAEALVFFLGGFSSDPQYPISGKGGPIFISDSNGNQKTSGQATANDIYQYNVDRDTPFFEFSGSLSIDTSSGLSRSVDEVTLLGLDASTTDLLPVYTASGQEAPYVYFDKRTYSIPIPGTTQTFFNHYTSPVVGATRPYRSTEIRTTVPATPANADKRYRYMNDTSFQLISAGLDDDFGGVPYTGQGGGPVFYQFPSGQSLDFGPYPSAAPITGALTGYAAANGVPSTQGDNATNFSGGILSDQLEN